MPRSVSLTIHVFGQWPELFLELDRGVSAGLVAVVVNIDAYDTVGCVDGDVGCGLVSPTVSLHHISIILDWGLCRSNLCSPWVVRSSSLVVVE